MCARFTLTTPNYKDLAELLRAQMQHGVEESYRPRYNIAPTEPHWVLATGPQGDRTIYSARWGLVNHWAKDAGAGVRQINARSETAHVQRSFKEAFVRRRCIVPADGFFEWTGPKKKRQPIWFHHPAGELLLMAGLYEIFKDKKYGPLRTFTILTRNSQPPVEEIHDRMPVIFSPDQADRWIAEPPPGSEGKADVEKLRGLLAEVDTDWLVGKEVTRRVNKVGHDDPSLLDPPENDEPPQGSLF